MQFCLYFSRIVIISKYIFSLVEYFQDLAQFALIWKLRLWNVKKIFLMVRFKEQNEDSWDIVFPLYKLIAGFYDVVR